MNFVIIAAEITKIISYQQSFTYCNSAKAWWDELDNMFLLLRLNNGKKKRGKKFWSMFDPGNQSKNDTVAKNTFAAKV